MKQRQCVLGKAKVMCKDPDTTESIACLNAESSSIRLAFRIGVAIMVVTEIYVWEIWLLTIHSSTFYSLLTKPPITSPGPGNYGQLENE